MTLGEARRALADAFRAAGLDSPELDARLLIGHALDLDRTALAASAGRELSAAEARATALDRRSRAPDSRRPAAAASASCHAASQRDIAPIAPLSTLGFVWDASNGLIALAYVLGGVCMYFTAKSYAIMSESLPTAGSVYGFARHALGAFPGFLAGWRGSGMPLRRWLMNGISFYGRGVARDRMRDRLRQFDERVGASDSSSTAAGATLRAIAVGDDGRVGGEAEALRRQTERGARDGGHELRGCGVSDRSEPAPAPALPAVGEPHAHVVGAANDVLVGHDEALRRDDEARAERGEPLGVLHLGIEAVEELVREEGEERAVAHHALDSGAGYHRSGGHGRAHQVSPRAGSLTADKIAVGSRDATLAGRHAFAVGGEAH